MTIVQTQKSIAVHCPNCGHYKTRHDKFTGCAVCAFQIAKGWQKTPHCLEHFVSRLTPRELEQARAASKTNYMGKTKCATCFEIWWAHDGMLCPNGETLFVPMIGDN
jgi:ribosomal protein L32